MINDRKVLKHRKARICQLTTNHTWTLDRNWLMCPCKMESIFHQQNRYGNLQEHLSSHEKTSLPAPDQSSVARVYAVRRVFVAQEGYHSMQVASKHPEQFHLQYFINSHEDSPTNIACINRNRIWIFICAIIDFSPNFSFSDRYQ